MARFKNWTAEAAYDATHRRPAKPAKPETANGITAKVLIGIDPGTNTGFAVKDADGLKVVETLTIWAALNRAKAWKGVAGSSLFVRVEDARQRTWFGNTGPEKWKGAGSIARDCSIWEEFLTAEKIAFEMVHPKNVKATTPEQFKALTGWTGRTSIHAREAAWLIL